MESCITFQTRQLSLEDIKPKRKQRYKEILDSLIKGTKTAREVAEDLHYAERNCTAPRLTELAKMGLVKVIDKKKCQYTGKTVAVYEITPQGIEQRFSNHIPKII